MADIKTKDNAKGTIRTIDKAAVATQRMKQAYIATKEKAERSVNANSSSAEEYASDKLESGIDEVVHDGAYAFDKHISVDIFSDEYMDKINAIQLPNTKIKILQRLLSQAIDEFKKVNKIMGVEFADRLKRVVDEYNNRRRDEAYVNEVSCDLWATD